MIVKNNIIVECTEDEIYEYWLKIWSDFIDFDTYLRKCESMGTKIIKKESKSE